MKVRPDKASSTGTHSSSVAPGYTVEFVNDDVVLLENLPDGLRSLDQWREVGALVLVDGRGHGDDEDVAVGEIGEIVGETQVGGAAQFFVADFERCVVAGLERGDARRVDVEADDGKAFAKFDRQWQANVAQAHDGNVDMGRVLNDLPGNERPGERRGSDWFVEHDCDGFLWGMQMTEALQNFRPKPFVVRQSARSSQSQIGPSPSEI